MEIWTIQENLGWFLIYERDDRPASASGRAVWIWLSHLVSDDPTLDELLAHAKELLERIGSPHELPPMDRWWIASPPHHKGPQVYRCERGRMGCAGCGHPLNASPTEGRGVFCARCADAPSPT